MTVEFRDWSAKQSNPFPLKKGKDGKPVNTSKLGEDGKTIARVPSLITGITIHQTACVFGPLDNPEKRYLRALNVPAHVVAFRTGVVVQTAPLPWFLYHGNALNSFTLGLEVEGHYPGRLDDPTTPRREDEESTWGDAPTPLDALALESAREGLRQLVERGRAAGMPIQYIWAHRQSNADRRSDPGAEIWQKVVLDFGVPKLGLKTRIKDSFRDGAPIPAAWDPAATAPY